MITLITGAPGSGKTLRSVHLITEALAQGRPVYSDIDGIVIPGVQPAPDDWRDTPEGSLVVFDEVQRRWPSTGRPGHADEEDIRALETHRHTAHDLIVITQHPTLVHHHVRKLVGEHVHVRRVSGAPVVSLFTSSEVFDPSDRNALRNCDKQTWRYPKKLFSQYKSATAHTVKFRIPAKLKYIVLAIIAIFSVVGYLFLSGGFLGFTADAHSPAPPSGESVAPTAAAPSFDVDPVTSALVSALSRPSLPAVSGCMVVNDRCRCWSSEREPLPLRDEECRLVASEMPR